MNAFSKAASPTPSDIVKLGEGVQITSLAFNKGGLRATFIFLATHRF